MFVDARGIPAGTRLDTDLCVIGAGAAGIAMAREFAGSAVRVYVLEGGGFRSDRETQSLYEGESIGLPYEVGTTRARFFGGSTNLWSGYCRPFDASQFEPRPWVPYSGWPITYGEIAPYYRRAAEVCGIDLTADSLDHWRKTLRNPRLSEIRSGGNRVRTTVYQKATSRRRFRNWFGTELKGAKNVQVYLNANVTQIQLTEDAQHVRQVRVACLSGSDFTVVARVFILATGGIENARLLLASREVISDGIGNQHDLVGRFFMDHPRLRVGYMRFRNGAKATDFYDSRFASMNLPALAELGLSEETQRSEGLLDWSAHVEAVPKHASSAAVESFLSVYKDLKVREAPRAIGAHCWRMGADLQHLLQFLIGYKLRIDRFIEGFEIVAKIEQCPNPASRVMLSHEKDQLGVNKVRLDWRLTELDKHTFRRAQDILRAEIPQAEVDSIGAWDGLSPQWTWHHMGTTRMHDDPKQGVVDRNCQVHGVKNLFVAGSSVFPTAGKNTPTLTIIALAIRLADHLRSSTGGLASTRLSAD